MPSPRPSLDLTSLEQHPAWAEMASRLFYLAAVEGEPAAYLRQALPLVCQTLGGDYLALLKGEKGIWRTLGASGEVRPVPEELLAEALDRDQPVAARDWYVAPLAQRARSGEMLAAYRIWATGAGHGPRESTAALETLATWLHAGLAAVRQRQAERQRAERLETLLGIASQW